MTHKKPISSLKIALYEPDIPQNTAAIIRTCSCLGADIEIIKPCGFLLTDKRFKRVVMDYMDFDRVKFYESSEDFFRIKRKSRVILMTTKAKNIYTNFQFEENDTILFGKESGGVPEKVHRSLKYKLRVPMVEKKRSLNLSTSVAITISEWVRQING
tara:strand:+ start:45 stop:515 length:471 start_codon:yes stop_codon:yes gene_type:complete